METEVSLSKAENSELALKPTAEELAVLNRTERAGFWLTEKMNQGAWKRLMTFFQRHIGSLWIYLGTYNLMNVYGLENFEKTDVETVLDGEIDDFIKEFLLFKKRETN